MWLTLHVATTLGLTGLIWVVQLIIYPQFSLIGRAEFRPYHADYTRRMTWCVGPLLVGELGSAAMLGWEGESGVWFWASLGLLGVNWASTAMIQVPLHRRLANGFAPGAHRALVRSNWVRTAAWTLRAALVLYGFSGSSSA
jgi:hypothetical protein